MLLIGIATQTVAFEAALLLDSSASEDFGVLTDSILNQFCYLGSDAGVLWGAPLLMTNRPSGAIVTA